MNGTAWKFLIGDRVGEWTGESGAGSGSFNHSPDLQDIMNRRRWQWRTTRNSRAGFGSQ